MKYLFYLSLFLSNVQAMNKPTNFYPIMRSQSISVIIQPLTQDANSHLSMLPTDIHFLLRQYYCFIQKQEHSENEKLTQYLKLDNPFTF